MLDNTSSIVEHFFIMVCLAAFFLFRAHLQGNFRVVSFAKKYAGTS